jgi:hypothetical protein
MNSNFKKIYNFKELIFLIFYSTIIIGYLFNEDTLGGAKHDFLHHFKISEKFNINFYETFKEFGDVNAATTRNSPVFWIIIGFLNQFFSLEIIKLLNSSSSLFIAFVLYKCLVLKFKSQKKIFLILLSSTIFLSPTIRSLSIWPYSLIWGLLLFIISIYFFLRFEKSADKKISLILSIKLLSFLILSSYIYPSFGIFCIYFYFHFYKKFGVSKYLFFLLSYSFILSIPAIYYIFTNDVLKIFNDAQGVGVNLSQAYNLSNKIMIISTMFLFFILPIISWKQTFYDFRNISHKTLIFILIFSFLNIYFFNFLYVEGGAWGGGFFHKFSNILFKNNFIFYIFFILSAFIIYSVLFKKWDNYLLLILLVAFNPQFTIYNKYFDPLIYILFLTLFQFNMNKHFFKKKYKNFQLYFLSTGYLGMALFKNYLL